MAEEVAARSPRRRHPHMGPVHHPDEVAVVALLVGRECTVIAIRRAARVGFLRSGQRSGIMPGAVCAGLRPGLFMVRIIWLGIEALALTG